MYVTIAFVVLGVVTETMGYHLFPRAVGDGCKGPEGKGTCQATSNCKGIAYPNNYCPKDPVNVQCCVTISCSTSIGKGFCRSRVNNGCDGGQFVSGACPGGSDISCCIKNTDATCSTPSGAGKCVSVKKTGCSGGKFFDDYCPGGDDLKCCVPKKETSATACTTPSGKGVCKSVKNDGCAGGKFISGFCSGGDDTKCCVKTTSSSPGSGSSPTLGGRMDSVGLNHLKQAEGTRYNFYTDSTGHRTIGVGHNCDAHPGTCEKMKPPLTQAQVDELLQKDLIPYMRCICEMPYSSQLTANQYSALVSYAFNSGCQGAKNAFNSYMERKDFLGICKVLPATNTLNGLLKSRRQKEGALCALESGGLDSTSHCETWV